MTARAWGASSWSACPNRTPLPSELETEKRVAEHPAGRVCRVLVVDDNVPSAESLCLIMKLWGHECRVTHSGPEAIEEAEIFKPDVILLDIGLPGMDGYASRRISGTAPSSRPHS